MLRYQLKEKANLSLSNKKDGSPYLSVDGKMAVYVKDLWKEGGSPSPLNEEKMAVSVKCLYQRSFEGNWQSMSRICVWKVQWLVLPM
jgi:hypothetical protein